MSLVEELTAGPLADELAPLIAAGDDAAIYNVMHRQDVPAKGILPVHAVKKFVSMIDLRLPILDSQDAACRQFTLALEDFEKSGFDLSDENVLAKITAVMSDLEEATLTPPFLGEHKLYILSMADKLISRAEQSGISINYETIAQALEEIRSPA